jgi:hypothetical protein
MYEEIQFHTWLGFCQLYLPELWYVLQRFKQYLLTLARTNAKCFSFKNPKNFKNVLSCLHSSSLDCVQMCLTMYFLRITKLLYVNIWNYYWIQFFISSRNLKNIVWKMKTSIIQTTGFSSYTESCFLKIIILLLPCPLYMLQFKRSVLDVYTITHKYELIKPLKKCSSEWLTCKGFHSGKSQTRNQDI